MFFNYAVLIMSAFALCLMIISAKAQTTDDDRRAVVEDQRALDEGYKQLEKDRLENNTAGVEVDQDNIDAMQQDFRTDEQRTIEDDQSAVAADEKALARLSAQLQQDRKGNTGAADADAAKIAAAQQRLQADKRQTIADDGLEVTRDRQALENENRQLQDDLQGTSSIAATTGATGTVRADEENIRQMKMILQHAQTKLQADDGRR